MGQALDELQKDLDERHSVAKALLGHMERALAVYQVRANTKMPEINNPRCSREHLQHIVRELTAYVEELSRVLYGIPRLLEDGTGMEVD